MEDFGEYSMVKRLVGSGANVLAVFFAFWITHGASDLYAQAEIGNKWKLVWADEFEKDGAPDPAKWNYQIGFLRNKEAQLYTERQKNVRVEGGHLVIEARKEKVKNPKFGQKATHSGQRTDEFGDYSSGAIETLGKASWTYGRMEVRAKIPVGRGTWPAIWMMGINKSRVYWPTCGEIDIMENVGFAPNMIHANVHNKKYNHRSKNSPGKFTWTENPDKFHIYAVEWYEDRIDFYFNKKKYLTYEKEDGATSDSWPYDKPFYLILNLAIGGGWGGKKGIDDTEFPHRFLVDYVRVYQRE